MPTYRFQPIETTLDDEFSRPDREVIKAAVFSPVLPWIDHRESAQMIEQFIAWAGFGEVPIPDHLRNWHTIPREGAKRQLVHSLHRTLAYNVVARKASRAIALADNFFEQHPCEQFRANSVRWRDLTSDGTSAMGNSYSYSLNLSMHTFEASYLFFSTSSAYLIGFFDED